MFGSDLLEVGVGMALLFFFMSLIATSLIEIIENVLRSRSKYLEKAISELLRGHTPIGTPAGTGSASAAQADDVRDFISTFYRHPIIASLYEGDYSPKGRHLPSYIPRENFSLALLDIVSRASVVGKALSLGSLRDSLADVQNPNAAQRVILTAIDTSNDDIQKVRQTLEQWFDGTMDRCSGWYTRRSGRILLVIGLVATTCFNVDAITVAERLLNDSALRKVVVASATKTIEKAEGQPLAESPPAGADSAAKANSFDAVSREFLAIGFPIGWKMTGGWLPSPIPQCSLADPRTNPQTCSLSYFAIIRMIFGWLITTLAISLGAPFWFDIMNRFVVIRSTVKPTEKSPNEVDRKPPSSEVVLRVAGTTATTNPAP